MDRRHHPEPLWFGAFDLSGDLHDSAVGALSAVARAQQTSKHEGTNRSESRDGAQSSLHYQLNTVP
jgi:hypothetical protein